MNEFNSNIISSDHMLLLWINRIVVNIFMLVINR
jgi:hypothetical protein